MAYTQIQFECGTCDHIGYAQKNYAVRESSDVFSHLTCASCGETFTDLDSLDEEDELPDMELGVHEFDNDGFDADYGEVD